MNKCFKILTFLFFGAFFFSTQLSFAKESGVAPDFKLQDINQDMYTLSSYKDKQPVVILFWATWCPFCDKEIRVLNQMYPKLVADGVEVLSVDVGELPDRVSDVVKNYHLAYRVLLDTDTQVALSYGAVGVPLYVFIDKKGDILFRDNYFSSAKYKELIAK